MTAMTTYEANQNFNTLTRYLHSFRFRSLMACLTELSQQITDRPIEVLELGCNTGRAYEAMHDRFRVNYRGVDIDEEVIATARLRYASRNDCAFLLADAADPQFVEPGSADIVIALETFEHIPEAAVVRIVENVAHIVLPRLFVVSVPIEIGPAIWIKYLGSKLMGYRRSRIYTWRYVFWAGLLRPQQGSDAQRPPCRLQLVLARADDPPQCSATGEPQHAVPLAAEAAGAERHVHR